MRLPELKSLARDRRLRNCSRMRKAELVAFLQNNEHQAQRRPPPPQRPARTPEGPPQAHVTLKFDDKGSCRIHGVSKGNKEIVTNERYFIMPWKMANVDGKRVSLEEAVDEIFSKRDELTNSTYVTLKLYEKGCCRIHGVSDGDKEIVTNERYVVMPWKAANRHGKSVALAEAVDVIFSRRESKAKERERREREREEIERRCSEYYEAHMKVETERLKSWVNWYEVKLDEIREAPVDSRLKDWEDYTESVRPIKIVE